MILLYAIIGVTVLIFFQSQNNYSMVDRGLFKPYNVKHYREFHRLITSVFLHADINHLIFNMFSLYMFGRFLVEGWSDTYGPTAATIQFGLLYFLGGLFAEIWPYSKYQDHVYYASLGASGAVSAVVFAAVLWHPTLPMSLLFIPVSFPAYVFAPIYLVAEYLMMKSGKTNIGHEAHIGGAIFGLLFVLLLNPQKGKDFIDIITGLIP
jgi:membrane associated rhomboid family serine protease